MDVGAYIHFVDFQVNFGDPECYEHNVPPLPQKPQLCKYANPKLGSFPKRAVVVEETLLATRAPW